jgi:hypothetical protein
MSDRDPATPSCRSWTCSEVHELSRRILVRNCWYCSARTWLAARIVGPMLFFTLICDPGARCMLNSDGLVLDWHLSWFNHDFV